MTHQTRLFVSNIPDHITETDLRSAFSVYGEIENVNLKCKSEDDNLKKFAFVTLSASSYNVESCIKHFSSEDFNGSKLYVTRARESFLERLQREREHAQQKTVSKNIHNEDLPKTNPVINLSEKLNPWKRIIDNETNCTEEKYRNQAKISKLPRHGKSSFNSKNYSTIEERKESMVTEIDEKKQISDTKRLESLKKKRNEFREKQKIIKTGLVGIDKVQNKKVIFSDEEQTTEQLESNEGTKTQNQSMLFEDDDSDDEVNFKIKEQFEGKNGQKVLDLQSKYKSDKRFTLDKRFIDDESGEENNNEKSEIEEDIVMGPEDEKTKQLNILQDVLGVQIKTSVVEPSKDSKKNKPKLGMLRFDPNHPDHAKFIVPVEQKQEPTKKLKKKKTKEVNKDHKEEQPEPDIQKVEVSKKQFYKVSESLKEAIAKPTTFSLRSLFSKNEEHDDKEAEDSGHIPLELSKETKVKNPLDPGEKNPFRYDSSDSDDEDNVKQTKDILSENSQPKAVWKENMFLTKFDERLKEGLNFFNNFKSDSQKERRELKSLMKKRIHNAERKNQMFQKKIGGRKKTMKKRFKTKR